LALPLQRSARLAATLGWTHSHEDSFAFDGTSMVSRLSGGDGAALSPVAGIHTAQATWKRVLARDLDGWVGAGPTLTTRRDSGDTSYRGGAAGVAGLRHATLRRNVAGEIFLRSSPMLDRITGNVYDRGDLAGALTWRARRSWQVDGGAAGGRVLGGPQRGQGFATGGGAVTWEGRRKWPVTSGVRFTWQGGGENATPGQPPGDAASLPAVRVWEVYLGWGLAHRGRLWPL
jgi:hypothetical protein